MHTISFFIRRWSGALLLAGTLVLFTAGCDFVAEQAGIDEVELQPDFARNVPVASGGAHAAGGAISRDGVDLPGVFDVAAVRIEQEDISYTPLTGTAKTGRMQGSGTIEVLLVVSGYPAVLGELTITDDVVTAVSPSSFAVGAYDEADVAALLEELPEAERPDLAADWQSLSEAELVEKVNEALRSASFYAALAARGSGDLAGTLSIEKMTFELDF